MRLAVGAGFDCLRFDSTEDEAEWPNVFAEQALSFYSC